MLDIFCQFVIVFINDMKNNLLNKKENQSVVRNSNSNGGNYV